MENVNYYNELSLQQYKLIKIFLKRIIFILTGTPPPTEKEFMKELEI